MNVHTGLCVCVCMPCASALTHAPENVHARVCTPFHFGVRVYVSTNDHACTRAHDHACTCEGLRTPLRVCLHGCMCGCVRAQLACSGVCLGMSVWALTCVCGCVLGYVRALASARVSCGSFCTRKTEGQNPRARSQTCTHTRTRERNALSQTHKLSLTHT